MIEDSIIPAILGRPTFASLVVSNSIAFADLESTFPAASYSGRYAVVVINGMNVLMQSSGFLLVCVQQHHNLHHLY